MVFAYFLNKYEIESMKQQTSYIKLSGLQKKKCSTSLKGTKNSEGKFLQSFPVELLPL